MNNLPVKIGVITDVHGNLPALTAVLDKFDSLGISQIVHTGDVVDIGPNSRECLQLLVSRGAKLVLGNHDFAFFHDYAFQHPASKVTATHKRYVFDSMQDLLPLQSLFTPQINLEVYGVKLVFTHYALLDTP